MIDCHFLLTVLLVGFATSQGLYIVERVENPSYAEEYRCVGDAAPENTAYTWQRQGWHTLPDRVQADGDRLHFLKSTSDLNGLYICTATIHSSINYASFYRHESKTEDTFLNWILDIDDPQLVYVMPVENPTYAEEYKCVVEGDPENTQYSWRRQDGNLPEDVKAEGNRLHFLKLTSDLNGLYICKTLNNFGEGAGSLYRYKNKAEFHDEF